MDECREKVEDTQVVATERSSRGERKHHLQTVLEMIVCSARLPLEPFCGTSRQHLTQQSKVSKNGLRLWLEADGNQLEESVVEAHSCLARNSIGCSLERKAYLEADSTGCLRCILSMLVAAEAAAAAVGGRIVGLDTILAVAGETVGEQDLPRFAVAAEMSVAGIAEAVVESGTAFETVQWNHPHHRLNRQADWEGYTPNRHRCQNCLRCPTVVEVTAVGVVAALGIVAASCILIDLGLSTKS